MISDKLETITATVRHYAGHGANVGQVEEIVHRLDDVATQAKEWEATALPDDAYIRMREAILYIADRVVMDYALGQVICPLTESWRLLADALAAATGRNEIEVGKEMKKQWEACKPRARAHG